MKKHRKAERILESSLSALGLNKRMQTQPAIVLEVLKEMKLNTFKTSFQPMRVFLSNATTKAQPLAPLLDLILSSITTKHPAIVEFVELALEKKWLKKSERVIYAVHVTYILEAITAAMCNSHDFFIEVHDHYKVEEKKLSIDTRNPISTFFHAMKITSDYFKIAKAYSLDPLMIFSRLLRGLTNTSIEKNELKRLFKERKINYVEYKLLLKSPDIEHILKLVRINIYEAGITEYKNGFKPNALTAHELSEYLVRIQPETVFERTKVSPSSTQFYKSLVQKENKFPTIATSQEWASLYTTWNMAFILGNLTDLDMIFPKLFIPSLLNGESKNFLGVRFISLWLSINHVLFRKSNKKEVLGPENKVEMATAWSEINKKYAHKLAKREMHENSKILTKNYRRFFSHPIRNFVKLLFQF